MVVELLQGACRRFVKGVQGFRQSGKEPEPAALAKVLCAAWRVHAVVEEKTGARACGIEFRVLVHLARADFPCAQAAETDALDRGAVF